MRRMEADEDAEQMAVIDWWDYACRRYGLEPFDLLHIPNEGSGSPVRGKRLKRLGVRAGCPDLLLTQPRGGFHGLFVEMKAKHGRPSPEQKLFLARLVERGYLCEVAYGADQAMSAIQEYLDGGRSAR